MLFHVFSDQEERRNFGGTSFIEMQFCKLPVKTKIKTVVAIRSINNWQNDSLYIDDEVVFSREYSHIFDCGIYNNLESGLVDIFGINYYSPSCLELIIKRVQKEKPVDYEILIDWLNKAKEYNGFYILGI